MPLNDEQHSTISDLINQLPTLAGNSEYESTEYHNTEHLRISAQSLKEKGCVGVVSCAILVRITGEEEYLNFDILASSSVNKLQEEVALFGSIRHQEYTYYEFYNPCALCNLTIFMDILSPSVGGVLLYIDYSPDQSHTRMPTISGNQFQSYQKTEIFTIDS